MNITRAIAETAPDGGIRAIVLDGVVTLEGTVEWNFQKARIEACVCDLEGIRGAVNNIVVKPKKASRTDALSRMEGAFRQVSEAIEHISPPHN